MKFLRQLWSYARRLVSNRFEAAYQRWGDRSWLINSLQDAREDVNAATREELCRRHNYWVANSWIVQRIRCLFIQFSVGVEGLMCNPNSSDEVWNEAYTENYRAWCRRPELSSNLSMWELHIQWAGMLFDVGEIFVLKTQDALGRPALQTIDAHRVKTPPDRRKQDNVIDGIEYEIVNRNGRRVIGRPKTYFIRDDFETTQFDPIPAEFVIHKFKARRPGQLRGIPEGFAGMNTLHDYDDLHIYEMQAAKLASSIANVETNPSGELDVMASRRTALRITTQNANGTNLTKDPGGYYNVKLGSANMAIKTGDSIKQFQPERPTVATQDYWDLLITQICCAYNAPKLLVVPYSLQGTVTRADLDVCTNAYRANFEIIAALVREIYEWRTAWAIQFDRSLRSGATYNTSSLLPQSARDRSPWVMDARAPLDFALCIIRPPRAPNVDIGYTAKAAEIELRLGIKTMPDVYAEKQQDYRVQTRQIAQYLAFVKQVAAEEGVDPGQITSLAVEQAIQEPRTDTPESGDTPGGETSPEARLTA